MALSRLLSNRGLIGGSLHEVNHVDDEPFVGASCDRLPLVLGLDLECQPTTVDLDQSSPRRDLHADRRRGKMTDVDVSADGDVAVLQPGLDGTNGRLLDQHDQDRSGQDVGARVLHRIGAEVVGDRPGYFAR